MSATAEIRDLCDPSPGALRQALLAYAKSNRRAPPGIDADPNLYTDLACHYLEWSAELLTAMETAVAARPAGKAAVDQLVKLAHAYFHDNSRWPSAARLGPPLNLIIPAYYAVRGAQEVNSWPEPELLRADFTEAHEFVVEILGQAVSDKICQHKNADLKKLPRVAEEAPPAAQPLQYQGFLHAAQRKRLAKARAPKPVAPIVPLPPPAPPVTIEKEKILALSWSLDLSDTRIVLEETNSFSPGAYCSHELFLDLIRGHRFRLLERNITRVSGTSLGLGGPSEKESHGEWKIEVGGERPRLLLAFDEGGTSSYGIRKGGRNYLTLDGRDREWRPL